MGIVTDLKQKLKYKCSVLCAKTFDVLGKVGQVQTTFCEANSFEDRSLQRVDLISETSFQVLMHSTSQRKILSTLVPNFSKILPQNAGVTSTDTPKLCQGPGLDT